MERSRYHFKLRDDTCAITIDVRCGGSAGGRQTGRQAVRGKKAAELQRAVLLSLERPRQVEASHVLRFELTYLKGHRSVGKSA
jgi:hypothetical protein